MVLRALFRHASSLGIYSHPSNKIKLITLLSATYYVFKQEKLEQRRQAEQQVLMQKQNQAAATAVSQEPTNPLIDVQKLRVETMAVHQGGGGSGPATPTLTPTSFPGGHGPRLTGTPTDTQPPR